MPVITIQQSDNFTTEQKAAVTKRITEVMVEEYGAKPESVMLFFQEFDNQNWGKSGLLNQDRKK